MKLNIEWQTNLYEQCTEVLITKRENGKVYVPSKWVELKEDPQAKVRLPELLKMSNQELKRFANQFLESAERDNLLDQTVERAEMNGHLNATLDHVDTLKTQLSKMTDLVLNAFTKVQ